MPEAVTPEELNARFSTSDHLRFERGAGGLVRAVVDHPACRGAMYLHGAHVASWAPEGREEVLFMSGRSQFEDAKPIRGGVPICFPWFGPKADDSAAPAHGLARLQVWTVTAAQEINDGARVEMSTIIEPFHVTHRVTFGPSLRMTLHVENASTQPARFEAALHTYLAVSDVRTIDVVGLEGVDYIDKVRGGERLTQPNEPIRFTGETDRVYLGTRSTCEVRDPTGGRTIRIAKEGSGATVVWNPWIEKAARMPDFGDDEWPGMVCVETCNVLGEAVQLAPGAAHEMTAEISVH